MTKEPQQPYGYVLVLRGLAKAAIELADRPASLRVLCVLADYMSPDGMCQFGQATVAARLGMTRQAVNKHLRILNEAGILAKSVPVAYGTSDATKAGKTLIYMLNITGMAEARAGQDEIDALRLEKRIRRDGLVAFRERKGIDVYDANMPREKALAGDRAAAKAAEAAMVKAEAAMGLRYEEDADVSEEAGLRYYRCIQIPPTPAPDAKPAQIAPVSAATAITPPPLDSVDFG